MQTLMTLIVVWLSINFGAPRDFDHPRIAFATPTELAEGRLGQTMPPSRTVGETDNPELSAAPEVYAYYNDASRTIYLPAGWSAASPKDVSILVHELVHHLQNAEGAKFGCPQEREKDAYRAQRAWLQLFDLSLEQEFELDGLTLLVRTNCMG